MKKREEKIKNLIVVLGGAMIKGENGIWRTSNYNEPGDKFGPQGDWMRVVAAAYLCRRPEDFIIVSGGAGQLCDVAGAPPVSSVIKKELIELGVPREKIIEESQSGSTYQQLLELKRLAAELKPEKVIIVSNGWHLPRIRAMIEYCAELKEFFQQINFDLISAEKVAIENEPERWEKIIENAFKSEGMQRRIALEEKGVQDIKEGKYKFN